MIETIEVAGRNHWSPFVPCAWASKFWKKINVTAQNWEAVWLESIQNVPKGLVLEEHLNWQDLGFFTIRYRKYDVKENMKRRMIFWGLLKNMKNDTSEINVRNISLNRAKYKERLGIDIEKTTLVMLMIQKKNSGYGWSLWLLTNKS